jgi:hypothetical protein
LIIFEGINDRKRNMWSVEEIRNNYKNFDDSKIKELAQNPKGLRKEIVPILNEEIKKRNLDINLIEWVNYETNTFEGIEKRNLIDKIRKSKCSLCLTNSKLSGYKFNTLISALIVIKNKTEIQIICSDCAKKKKIKSMTKTFFLGWWSKKGMFSTPLYLIIDLINIFRKEAESKEIIEEFISDNTGLLRKILAKGNDLNEILATFNDSNN